MNQLDNLRAELGFHKYSLSELKVITDDFIKDATSGLSGNRQSLKMFPSLLFKDFKNSSKPKIVVALDAGGSLIKAAVVNAQVNNGTPSLELISKIISVTYKTTRTTLNEFVDQLYAIIKLLPQDLISKNELDLGFSFSFGFKPIRNDKYIDASLEDYGDELEKGFELKRNTNNVSQELRRNLPIKINNAVTLNDLTALVLVRKDSQIGLVVGTGYNIGFSFGRSKQIYFCETASFINRLINTYIPIPLQQLRTNLKSKGTVDLNEMQISGKYLIQLLALSLEALNVDDQELLNQIHNSGTSMISHILMGKEKLQGSSQETVTLVKDLIEIIITNATDLVAAQLAGAIKLAYPDSNNITIACDGSVLRFLPTYKERILSTLGQIIPAYKVDFSFVENSSLLGAAAAILTL